MPVRMRQIYGGERRDRRRAVYNLLYQPEGTRLEERSYTPQSDSFDGIMTELLEQFQTPMDIEVDSAMPDGVEINQCTL